MGPYLYLLLLAVLGSGAWAQNGETLSSSDKRKCINELLQWCQKRQHNVGVSLLSVSNQENGIYVSYSCNSDSKGTMCKKNGSPWFECFPDKTVTYEGKKLYSHSSVDNDICATKNRALQLGTGAFDNKAFQKGMNEFHKGMQRFNDEMTHMGEGLRRMFGGGFPFSYSYGRGSRGGFDWDI